MFQRLNGIAKFTTKRPDPNFTCEYEELFWKEHLLLKSIIRRFKHSK